MNIKQTALLIGLLLCIPSGIPAAETKQAPNEINGFRLDTSIEEYDFLRDRNYMREVIIEDIGGFRKGVISYGTCKRPGKIVKLQLKYKDSSHEFYEQLFQRYKEKFGKPDEFTGDPFGIVVAWKWRFVDENNNNITLTLHHNMKKLDENIGNQVKLSMPDRIVEERLCYKEQCEKDKEQLNCPVEMMTESWENMIPR